MNLPSFETTTNPVVKRIERTPTNGWKVLMAPGTVDYPPPRGVHGAEYGKMEVRTDNIPLIGIGGDIGVSTDLENHHVETFLKQGTREWVKEED